VLVNVGGINTSNSEGPRLAGTCSCLLQDKTSQIREDGDGSIVLQHGATSNDTPSKHMYSIRARFRYRGPTLSLDLL